jgi:hypothetical protein
MYKIDFQICQLDEPKPAKDLAAGQGLVDKEQVDPDSFSSVELHPASIAVIVAAAIFNLFV